MIVDEPIAQSYQPINLWQNAVVTCFFAGCIALSIMVLIASKRYLPVPRVETFVLMYFLIGVSCFNVAFPRFRLALMANGKEQTHDNRMKSKALWGLLWRSAAFAIPWALLAIPAGLYVVQFLKLLEANVEIFRQHQWLVFPWVFLAFFSFSFVMMYPLLFWWLRLDSTHLQILVRDKEVS